MQNRYTLYGRSNSGSFAVQVALEEVGAPYDRVWVGLEPEEVERFRTINPTGLVPALRLADGTLIFESAAMLIHLALTAPGANLAPRPASTKHAQFLQWMVFLSAQLYQDVRRIYYSARYSSRGEADAAAVRQQAMADFAANAALITPHLCPYLLGDEYSIADVYLYMLVSWYPEPAVLFAQLPQLGQHAALIRARPSVAKSEADHKTE